MCVQPWPRFMLKIRYSGCKSVFVGIKSYINLHMTLTPCFMLSFAWSAMSDMTATAAVKETDVKKWTMNIHNWSDVPLLSSLLRKSPNIKPEMKAWMCLQVWTGVAPLLEIKDIVAETGLLMNYTLQSSHRRALKSLFVVSTTNKVNLNWLSDGRLSMPNESKKVPCKHSHKHRPLRRSSE